MESGAGAGGRAVSDDLTDALAHAYEALEGSEAAQRYSERHGIRSAAILTVYNDEIADTIAATLAPRIAGKVVVEIGGGIGLLGCHLAQYAERVYCIEANPAWAWTFVGCLLHQKPKNLSYLFGAADQFVGLIRAHVALFCTHSGVESMREVGGLFAPTVIDVWGDLISDAPHLFNPEAARLRKIVT
jgi:hypothetical protein